METEMNNAVALRRDLTPPQMTLARNTIAKDCNGEEFNLFIAVAQRTGLDPLRKQISAIVFNKGNAAKRQMAIITNIDGLRVIAARQGDYRPMDTAPVIIYDEALKGPTNPLGIDYAQVQCWKRYGTDWFPIIGQAYWVEFAPCKDEWVNGQKTGAQYLAENWAKMPRLMIAKVAEAQALRRGWPEDMSGLYEQSEMDRSIIIDATATEIVEQHAEQEREKRIGGGQRAYFVFASGGAIETIERGQIADRIASWVESASAEDVKGFKLRNAESLKQFWAWEPSDALAVKKMMEDKIASSTPNTALSAVSPAVDSSPLPAGATDAEQKAPAAAVVQSAPQQNLGGGGTLFDESEFQRAWSAFEAKIERAGSRAKLAELQSEIMKSAAWINANADEQEEMKQRIMRKLRSF
jgi:phage recombination protein Bet